jgi:hypothetical protein
MVNVKVFQERRATFTFTIHHLIVCGSFLFGFNHFNLPNLLRPQTLYRIHQRGFQGLVTHC